MIPVHIIESDPMESLSEADPLYRRAGLDVSLTAPTKPWNWIKTLGGWLQTPDKLHRQERIRRLVRRASRGQFVLADDLASEVCERFLQLSDEDQAKLWENVRDEADYENWLAGAPGENPRIPKPKPRRTVLMPENTGHLTVETVLSRLESVRRSGKKWIARCPVHEDRSPSLVISERDDGGLGLYCFAGCEFKDIIAAIKERASNAS